MFTDRTRDRDSKEVEYRINNLSGRCGNVFVTEETRIGAGQLNPRPGEEGSLSRTVDCPYEPGDGSRRPLLANELRRPLSESTNQSSDPLWYATTSGHAIHMRSRERQLLPPRAPTPSYRDPGFFEFR